MNVSAHNRAAKVCGSIIAVAPLIMCAIAAWPACAEQGGSAEANEGLEEIYVLRSIREQHDVQQDRCTALAIGFDPYPVDADRRFSLWSVASRPGDGLVVDTARKKVASLRGCFGQTDDRTRQNFQVEILMGSKLLRGRGECQALLLDFPEQRLIPVRCQVVLSDVPAPYVGGLLTTNTLTSGVQYGGATSPPGYTQASIATIRLWKKR